MIKRPLGNTGIDISELAFGGVEIGIPYGINIKDKAGMPAESEAIKLLHASLDSGINFFDTARMYGGSERIIGKAFKGKRDKIVLETKCVHFKDEKGNIPAYSELKKIVEDSLHESLKALQTDYIDIYMLHSVDMRILESEDVTRIFSDLRKAGKIRLTGASTYTPDETGKAIDTGVWNVIQLPFNLLDQRHNEHFTRAFQQGVGIVIRSVLMKGILSDRGKNLHPALLDVENHLPKYSELIVPPVKNLSALATKFALSFPEVSSVLIGLDRMEYLQQALNIVDGNYLTKDQLARARELAYPDPEFLNLPYWSKMKWL